MQCLTSQQSLSSPPPHPPFTLLQCSLNLSRAPYKCGCFLEILNSEKFGEQRSCMRPANRRVTWVSDCWDAPPTGAQLWDLDALETTWLSTERSRQHGGNSALWPPLAQRTGNCDHPTLLHTGIQSKHLSFPMALLWKQISSPTATTAFFSVSVVFLGSVPAGLQHP